MDTFLIDAIRVLQEKGYQKHSYPLDALSQVIETNSNIVARKIRFYKWFGLLLLTLIPLISALVSVSVGLKGDNVTLLEATILSLSLPLSLLLTVFTILNSIFRPSERFRNACLVGIRITAFKCDFLTNLERLEKIDETVLLDFVKNKSEEFEQYQVELIGMFMPMEGAPADTKKKAG